MRKTTGNKTRKQPSKDAGSYEVKSDTTTKKKNANKND